MYRSCDSQARRVSCLFVVMCVIIDWWHMSTSLTMSKWLGYLHISPNMGLDKKPMYWNNVPPPPPLPNKNKTKTTTTTTTNQISDSPPSGTKWPFPYTHLHDRNIHDIYAWLVEQWQSSSSSHCAFRATVQTYIAFISSLHSVHIVLPSKIM